MAVGLSPKYTLDFPLEDLTSEQFLTLSIEAAKKLGWNIGPVSSEGFIAYTQFSMSSWSEEFEVTLTGSFATLKSECTGNQVVDWGKNKRNIEDFISTFNELKTTVSGAELAKKIEEIRPSITAQESAGENGPIAAKGTLPGVLAIFKPVKGFFITPILIDINIAVFIIMALSGVSIMQPDNEMLLRWGANFRPSTLSGEWWRLLTNVFLHAGIFHLLMNMYALLFIGILLEPRIGSARFLSAYLFTGLVASTNSLWWHEVTVSLGASGAIFGMYGVFLALLTTNYVERTARKAQLTSIGIFVVYNLANGLKGNIDNAAHIGGLISGIVIGYIYFTSLKAPERSGLRNATIGISACLAIGVTIFVLTHTTNDIGIYQEKLQTFTANENNALEALRLPDNTAAQTRLVSLKQGINYWQQDIGILEEFKKLHLPEQLVKRNELLAQYCKLRIDTYQLLYMSVSENTSAYNDKLKDYVQQTETVMNSLKGL